MTNIIIDGIEHILLVLLQGLLKIVGAFGAILGKAAALQTALPWVQAMKSDVLTVTWSLFGVALAWIIFTRYIMWNEGTADPDGSGLMKNVLRAGFYVGISSTLATVVWNFGYNFATYLIASPVGQAANLVGKNTGALGKLVGINADAAIVIAGILGTVIAVIAMIIMVFQFAIRSAELVFYCLSGPLMALGHLANPEGGVWRNWWTNLIILSLSAAPQFVALKGLVLTTQAIPAFAGAAGFINLILALVMQVGWLVVGIRGPHMMKEWAYHSGAGSTFVGTGVSVGQQGLSKRVWAGMGKGSA